MLFSCDAIQIPNATNQQPVTRNGGSCHDNFPQIVASNPFEDASFVNYGDFTLLTDEINMPAGRPRFIVHQRKYPALNGAFGSLSSRLIQADLRWPSCRINPRRRWHATSLAITHVNMSLT